MGKKVTIWRVGASELYDLLTFVPNSAFLEILFWRVQAWSLIVVITGGTNMSIRQSSSLLVYPQSDYSGCTIASICKCICVLFVYKKMSNMTKSYFSLRAMLNWLMRRSSTNTWKSNNQPTFWFLRYEWHKGKSSQIVVFCLLFKKNNNKTTNLIEL